MRFYTSFMCLGCATSILGSIGYTQLEEYKLSPIFLVFLIGSALSCVFTISPVEVVGGESGLKFYRMIRGILICGFSIGALNTLQQNTVFAPILAVGGATMLWSLIMISIAAPSANSGMKGNAS